MNPTLADALCAVYRYYLASLTDAHEARIFARDWGANSTSLCAALRHVGQPAWWFDREPSGPADDCPFVIASIDPRSGELRFTAATARDTRAAVNAAAFDHRGSPLPRPGEEGPCAE